MTVLVHGVASRKGEYERLAAELSKLGIGSLAIDLRGHGESTQGPQGPADYGNFDATGEWSRAKIDVEAAIVFLRGRGLPLSRIGLIGASIGANLVSHIAAETSALRWVVLLSPGRDYRGAAVSHTMKCPALVAASPPDAYAFQTALTLSASKDGPVFLQAKAGHGAQMFDDSDFLRKLLDWLKARARA